MIEVYSQDVLDYVEQLEIEVGEHGFDLNEIFLDLSNGQIVTSRSGDYNDYSALSHVMSIICNLVPNTLPVNFV